MNDLVQKLTVRLFLASPASWDWMEVRLPIADQWTKTRYTKDDVEVSGS